MDSPKKPKNTPYIPDDAGDDKGLDYDSHGNTTANKQRQTARKTAPPQAEPRNHAEWLDLSKLQFGQKLIGWCIFLIVVLSLVDFAWQGANQDENPLAPAIELLKLVTTTALGFVFAKADMRRTPDDE